MPQEDLPQQPPAAPASSATGGMRVFQTMLSTEQAMLQMLRQMARDSAAAQNVMRQFATRPGTNVNNNEGSQPSQPFAAAHSAYQPHEESSAGAHTYRPVSFESLAAQHAGGPAATAGGGAGSGSGAGGFGGNGAGPGTPEGADTPEGSPENSGNGSGNGSGNVSAASLDQSSSGTSGGSGGSGVGPGSAGNSIPFVGGIEHAIGKVPILGGLVNSVLNSTVVGAYSKVTGEMQSQQDKNDYYRNIEGGGNENAIGERAKEEWFAAKDQASMTMSSGDARTIFKGITRLGYDNESAAGGYGRSSLLNFANNAKKERGQDTSETLSQASAFSKNATASLKEFNDALNSVSQTASKAGINTNMARAQMQGLFTQFTQQGMGKGATTTSAAITNMNNSIGGRAYSAGTDSSQMTSNNYESMVAASSGMNQAQLATGLRHGSASAYKAYDQFWSQNMVALTDGQKSWVKQYKSANPKVSNDKIADAFRDYFETGEGSSGPDAIGNENVWVANMQQQSGQDWGGDPHKAALFAVQLATGQNPLEKAASTKGGKTSTNMATSVAKAIFGGGGSGSHDPGSPAKSGPLITADVGGGKSKSKKDSKDSKDSKDKAAPKHKAASKEDGAQYTTSWNYLTGQSTHAQKSKPKSHEADGKPAHGQYGTKASVQHQTADTMSRIVIDTTPEAKKLIKAMVVTGGDPYKAAGAASAATPQSPHQTSTR